MVKAAELTPVRSEPRIRLVGHPTRRPESIVVVFILKLAQTGNSFYSSFAGHATSNSVGYTKTSPKQTGLSSRLRITQVLYSGISNKITYGTGGLFSYGAMTGMARAVATTHPLTGIPWSS